MLPFLYPCDCCAGPLKMSFVSNSLFVCWKRENISVPLLSAERFFFIFILSSKSDHYLYEYRVCFSFLFFRCRRLCLSNRVQQQQQQQLRTGWIAKEYILSCILERSKQLLWEHVCCKIFFRRAWFFFCRCASMSTLKKNFISIDLCFHNVSSLFFSLSITLAVKSVQHAKVASTFVFHAFFMLFFVYFLIFALVFFHVGFLPSFTLFHLSFSLRCNGCDDECLQDTFDQTWKRSAKFWASSVVCSLCSAVPYFFLFVPAPPPRALWGEKETAIAPAFQNKKWFLSPFRQGDVVASTWEYSPLFLMLFEKIRAKFLIIRTNTSFFVWRGIWLAHKGRGSTERLERTGSEKYSRFFPFPFNFLLSLTVCTGFVSSRAA